MAYLDLQEDRELQREQTFSVSREDRVRIAYKEDDEPGNEGHRKTDAHLKL